MFAQHAVAKAKASAAKSTIETTNAFDTFSPKAPEPRNVPAGQLLVRR